MNYLAHIYLSGADPEVQVGGLLGDFVKGPLCGGFPGKIEAGIRLHRRIDAVTDQHPLFRAQLAELPPPWRRFGGILLDLYFDHLLASRWEEFHARPLELYCADFYRTLARHREWLPPRAGDFSRRAPQVGWLEKYADRAMMPPMLNNLGQRLRRPVPLGEAWPLLAARHGALELSFDTLMQSHQQLARTFLRDHL